MEYFIQQLINGLTLGSIYGLVAIGYTMVYGIIGMINFAHGDIFMLGGFAALIVFLILTSFFAGIPVALALLFVRSALSQMDVPTRAAFVMAVVTPQERAAAASFTAVPRSLAAAASPAIGGALFAVGWLATPLVACGLLKIAYDLMLWRTFRRSEAAFREGKHDQGTL